MCGRFSIAKDAEDIVKRFDARLASAFNKVYNAAPTQKLPVMTNAEPSVINFFQWGLIPFWAKDTSFASKMINARAETISEKPAFRTLLKQKRCLIISDGFFEWKKAGGKKIPFRITLRDEGLYAYAGLWDAWNAPDNTIIHSFTIITTEANEIVKDIHDRMPVILKKEDEAKWIDKNNDVAVLVNLLKPYPGELIKAYPVSTLVNSVANNTEEIIKEI